MISEHDSDAALLERFVSRREEAAFRALVDRHGAIVLRTCRRYLRNEADVEDVFQATFLTLARKAPALAWNACVGAWLCSAARRLSLHAATDLARRHEREFSGASSSDRRGLDEWCEPATTGRGPTEQAELHELQRHVYELLGELPEKYRAPVVLCYLEGKTNEEAARQLGWAKGSMSRRLQRARSLLRRNLSRSGLVPWIVLTIGTLLFVAERNGLFRGTSPGTSRYGMSFPGRPGGEAAELQSALEQAVHEGRLPTESEQIGVLLRSVEWAEGHAAGNPPRGSREVWGDHKAELRLASLDLSRALRGGDDPTALKAARRLESACVRCHLTFRDGPERRESSFPARFHNPL